MDKRKGLGEAGEVVRARTHSICELRERSFNFVMYNPLKYLIRSVI